MMIYNTSEAHDGEAVVQTVADRLGLKRHPREPLSFDAVFVQPDAPAWDWFPFVVAVEHENDFGRFDGEIKKLLSVRCKLEVGITYVIGDKSRNSGAARAKIASWIERLYATIESEISEDPNTEYLFLMGCEVGGQRELEWFSIDFRSGDGPTKDLTFERVP
jgi:hypothetical protein